MIMAQHKTPPLNTENAWTVQDARAHLGDVIDAALKGKPQRVSRRGKDTVVLVSEEEWRRLSKPKMSFGEFLATFPGLPDDIDLMGARRGRDSRPNPFADIE
jgi:prevent-host-death family protein